MNFLFDNFDILANAPNGIKKLRELILQLAVMGKLVPQDPDDESAGVLLERIKKEKERLIKEGKIKRQKPLPEITEEEKPYELPKGWEWMYLDKCSVIIMGQSPDSKYYNNIKKGIPFYQGKADFGELYPTPRKWCTVPKKIAKNNDILISVRAPVGPTNICREKSCIGRGLASISTLNIYEHIYLLYTIRAFEKKISGMGVGSTFSAISLIHLRKILIPIPPLNEQKRIVGKVDRLMALCDELEKKREKSHKKRFNLNNASLEKLLSSREPGEFQEHWQRITGNFDILYNNPENVAKLKQAILQLAVMGKLVPQDPADEPASVLLKKIKEEKERLIKEGKIKKQKALPPITEDEKPYDLPSGWEWVRLRDTLLNLTDGTHNSPPNKDKGPFKYITAKNIKNHGIDLSNVTYVSRDVHEKIYKRCNPVKGDILYIKDGATTGIVTINNLDEPFSMLSSVALFKISKYTNNHYLLYFFRSPFFYSVMRGDMSGVAITRVTLSKMEKAVIAIPPLNEQKRIVSKVEQLMSLCDRLEENLRKTETKSDTLFNAVANRLIVPKSTAA